MSTKRLKACGKGHFYDAEAHSSCPYCGVHIDLPETVGMPEAAADPTARLGPPTESSYSRTRAIEPPHPPRPRDAERTRHMLSKRLDGVDPVVGWLVCIAGPDKGRDYRIHAERNFIGRSDSMDIAIAGDDSISRDNHAIISYNPKINRFSLVPGDGRGLTYVNDEELLGPRQLAPYDTIELGESRLLFVPFCGERFNWSVDAQQAQ